MPEQTPAEKAAAASATATNEAGNHEAFQVTKEDWEKLQTTLKSLSPIAAALRKEQQQKEKQTVTTTTNTTATEADETMEEPKTLKELRIAIAKEREEARKERDEARKEREEGLRIKKENGIRDAIKASGVATEAVDVLFDHIDKRHGSKISLVGDKPVLTDDLGETKDIGDFIGELLKSPQGSIFKPAKLPGPNARGSRGNTITIPGQKTFSEMSIDERLTLEKTNRPAYLALAQAEAMNGRG